MQMILLLVLLHGQVQVVIPHLIFLLVTAIHHLELYKTVLLLEITLMVCILAMQTLIAEEQELSLIHISEPTRPY